MTSILEDVQTSAEWISTALASSGYQADFSPDSLIEIDRFFAEHCRDGKAVRGGLLSESLGSRLFAVGAYVLQRSRESSHLCSSEVSHA